MVDSAPTPTEPEHDRLLEENRRLAQRYLELENAARRQIDKLKAANSILAGGETDMRLLLENAAVGFALLDLNMRVVSANQTLCALLGCTRDQLQGENFHNLVYVGKLPSFTRLTGQAADNSPRQDVIDLLDRDGRLVPCRVAASDWLADDGTLRGIFLLILDLNDEIRAAARLEEMEGVVAETGKARDLFLETVSRELRAPASGIAGMVRMLMEDRLTARQAELAGVIHSSASALIALIDDIVDSVGNGPETAARNEAIDPSALARAAANLFALRAEEKGLELRVHVSAAVPAHLAGDGTLLRRVLAHLLDNAVKYTERGHVSLTVDVVGDSVRFMVSDTGRGIADNQSDIFGEYATGFPERVAGEGMGVGLPLCRRLVAAMGGRLGYESEAGRGSEFHFTIPLILLDATKEDGEKAEPPPEAVHLPPLSILLADANPLSLRQASAYLHFDGHRLTTVDNGLEAAEKCRGSVFDLVLLDLHLPKLDGLQTLRIIRDDERTGGRTRVPALLLAPAGQIRDDDFYRRAGADGVVGKPVRPVELLNAMAAAAGVSPLTVARRKDAGQYAAQASGGRLKRIDAVQLVNLRQVMPGDQFLGLLRLFMDDAIPGIVALAESGNATPNRERLAFGAAKYRSLADFLGFSSLSELLRRLEGEARSREDDATLRLTAGQVFQAVDDSLEELKRILPDAFATISGAEKASGDSGD